MRSEKNQLMGKNNTMDSSREVICDKCGAVIENTGPLLQEQKIGSDKHGDIIEQFFVCPDCGAHYTVTVTDAKMRRMIRQRQEINAGVHTMMSGKGAHKPDKIRLKKLSDRDKKLKQDLLRYGAELKKQYVDV